MLMSPQVLRRAWGVHPRGVLHVGAHDAEEDMLYRGADWGDVVWVEAMPARAHALQQRFADDATRTVVQALAWDVTGDLMPFNIANNGQSSSVFALGTHARHHPNVVYDDTITLVTTRLDAVLPDAPAWNLINLDVQGAELHALKGLGHLMRNAQWVYAEVNAEPVYQGCPLLDELDDWLSQRAFTRVDTLMTGYGWGDALYVATARRPALVPARRMLRRMLQRQPRSGA